MANNPFYPGYTPKKQDEGNINPIYPGYYAGQPLQRKPASKDFIKPIEYKADEFMNGIDNAASKVLLSPIAAPRWILNRIVDDWKGQLKASIKTKDAEITELDDYATEDFPGAVISLSLNPKDWKDPNKQAQKTLRSWVKESTGLNLESLSGNNFSDIENKTNRQLWQEAMGYGTPESKLEKDAKDSIASRTVTQFGTGFQGKTDPLNLKNKDVTGMDNNGNPITVENVYGKTATAVADFVHQWDNAPVRESKRNDFVKESAKGVFTEISTVANDPTHQNIFGRHRDAIKLFGVQTQVLDDIGGLSKGLKNAKESLEKTLWNKDAPKSDALKALNDAITNTKKNLASRRQELSSLIQGNNKEAIAYNNALQRLDVHISRLEKARDQIDRKNGYAALDALRIESRNLTGGKLFDTSTQGILGEFNRRSMASGAMATVASDARDQGLELTALKITPIINRLERETVKYRTKEFLKSWDKENLLENIVWNRMKKTLPSWTGGQFIEDRLKRINYFGLKIDESGTPLKNDYGTPLNPRKFARFEKKYSYKLDMKIDPTFYRARRLTIKGGDSFKILENKLFKEKFKLENTADGALLRGVFSGNTDRDALAQKLFGVSLASVLADSKKEEQFKEFLKQTDSYSHWVKNQKDTFGNQVATDAFAFRLLSDLKAFNAEQAEGYKLTRTYIGGLEKIHKRALKIKQKWESSIFGKTIKTLQQWKTKVSERFAKYLSQIIAKALGIVAGATGPLGAVLAALESLVAFAVEKALAYGEAVIKGIFKGNFEDFAKMLSKDFNKVLKSCIVCSTILAVLIALPALLFISAVAINISPIDRTVGSTDYMECILPLVSTPGVLPPLDPNADEFVKIAYEYASRLVRGYWGSYNNSPDFPELWDPNTFGGNMCPTIAEARAMGRDSMFWCTWLIIKAMQDVDPQFPSDTWVPTMMKWYQSLPETSKFSYGWIDGAPSVGQLEPGMVIFFKTYNPANDEKDGFHAAIVQKVNSDGITIIQSNTGELSLTINTKDGSDQLISVIGEGGSSMTVVGFGTKDEK